jgi:NADPH:quinone reductase-like Zn-dependent oxidoreductase
LTALILAKAAGATTVITSSSDEKLEYVRSKLGADETINYKTHPDWSAEVQRITNGQGVDHIIEVGGVATIQQSLEAVAYGGVVSVIGFLTSLSPEKMPDLLMPTLVRGCVVRGAWEGRSSSSKRQLNSWEVVN